jgi:hypothetical protein
MSQVAGKTKKTHKGGVVKTAGESTDVTGEIKAGEEKTAAGEPVEGGVKTSGESTVAGTGEEKPAVAGETPVVQAKGGKTRKVGKGNSWIQLVTNTYRKMRKTNKNYSFKQAIKDSKKMYKKSVKK